MNSIIKKLNRDHKKYLNKIKILVNSITFKIFILTACHSICLVVSAMYVCSFIKFFKIVVVKIRNVHNMLLKFVIILSSNSFSLPIIPKMLPEGIQGKVMDLRM